eukprot:122193-Prymnesium_polylepis.4
MSVVRAAVRAAVGLRVCNPSRSPFLPCPLTARANDLVDKEAIIAIKRQFKVITSKGKWTTDESRCLDVRQVQTTATLTPPLAARSLHHAPCTMHPAPCTLHHAPCTMHSGGPS